jgi:hypothetical protein
MENQIGRFWTCIHYSGHEKKHFTNGGLIKRYRGMFIINASLSDFLTEVNGKRGFKPIGNGD